MCSGVLVLADIDNTSLANHGEDIMGDRGGRHTFLLERLCNASTVVLLLGKGLKLNETYHRISPTHIYLTHKY